MSFALNSLDYETQLIGPITDTIIDADRLARVEYGNGFPNFAMYRLVLAGDRLYMTSVRQWWVLFSIEWCRSNMRKGYSEELATLAAWDSLQRVIDPSRPILPSSEAAEALGVKADTYVRARDSLARILGAVLRSYWEILGATYRLVRHHERES